MALPQLLEALKEQAAARRAAELSRAEAMAEDIRIRSGAALERRRAELLSAARSEADQAARRLASEARTEAAERVLTARARLLGRVRSALDRRIRQATGDADYLESLAHDVLAAIDRLPTTPVVIRTRPGLAPHVSRAVRGREGVNVEPTEDVGVGFRASCGEAGVEMDGTLEARVEYAWPRLAVAVLHGVES